MFHCTICLEFRDSLPGNTLSITWRLMSAEIMGETVVLIEPISGECLRFSHKKNLLKCY